MSDDAAFLIVVVVGVLYVVPTITAFSRMHHQRVAIMALDLFLGWTLLGWVAAMVWALTATREQPPASSPGNGVV